MTASRASAARLRPGRLADLDALAAFERRFFTRDHQISRRGLRHFITSSKSSLLVAQAGNSVAGCVLVNFRRRSNIARLYTIAVDGEYQGRGLGRRLLKAAEAAALRRGRRVMRLEVRADDKAALTFYESSGYLLFGRRPRYYAGRIDALRFEKTLAAEPRRHSTVPKSN